ncbi:MAG TPA: SRPBCC domain-containing protein [Caulobacteraceae bacterium]|nr:SRPBCC domain-containing protein [Caulobacteraceae bacterium]
MPSQVIVALRVKADPMRAFEAFTAEIGSWWRHNPLFAFTPREPGVMAFQDGRLIETREGGKVFEVGKVSVWEPGRRLVFGWRQAAFTPDQATEVEVTFEPVGEETRVSVTHSGWDSVPASHVAKHGMPNAYFMQRHGEYWHALLSSMAEHLA